ncbi:MAG: thioredoxin domain-containing protein [Pseudazoarcus pumilus]|nr:thioredoxin domain-containing protein [Pseudazoarcus pumilus]
MPNRLATETSPYLLQHADNPVDWWPWCEEALALARAQDKPILLSIGYSSCHWCHVMAHECFEDAEVAALMNRDFINLKVDREERPDLDHIYQSAHQLLKGRPGGWPLTMFLTPDGLPFFGGTYFPKTPRYRLPGFMDLLRDVARAFAEERRELEAGGARLRAELSRLSAPAAAAHHSELDESPCKVLRDTLKAAFDRRYGGFGEAPKFPRASDLEFLLQRAATDADETAGEMALSTLTRMAEGGLFDHLGGGFYRYSTDEQWRIPHFEKMLCDNAALLRLYADAFAYRGDACFRTAVERTAAWMMGEMQSPEGGYYTALDADSEGHEGRFYVWDRKHAQRIVPPEAWKAFERHYGLDARAGFEGAWHLHVAEPLERTAKKTGLGEDEVVRLLDLGRQALLAERAGRVRPGCDSKRLAGWNGMMIAGMAHAGRVFGRKAWQNSARRAFDFVRSRMWQDGRLTATSDGGPGRFNAYLDDHAWLIDAALELLQCGFDAEVLAFAEDLADALLDDFEDRERGGFDFTRHDHEALILRPRPLHDNATASGNGVAARALARLAQLTGEVRYLDAAERTVRAAWSQLTRNPAGCASLVLALQDVLQAPSLVVLSGERDALTPLREAVQLRYLPRVMSLEVPAEAADVPPVLARRAPVGSAAAWVCHGRTCLPPVSDVTALSRMLTKQGFHG